MQLPAFLETAFARITKSRPGAADRRSADPEKDAAVEWKDIEYFDEKWRERIARLAAYVPPGGSVADLGCGKMWLRDFLVDCRYFPVDYRKRDEDTIICDFNKGEFPELDVDVAFVSGCLEYVENPEWFIRQIARRAKRCVISYCVTEAFPDPVQRSALGWKSDFSAARVIGLFEGEGMRLIERDFLPDSGNALFCFVK